MAEEQLQLDDNRLEQEVARSKIAAMPLHNFINVLRGRYHFSTPSICASLVIVNADNLSVSKQEQGLTTVAETREIALPKNDDPAIIEKEEKTITEKTLYFESLEMQRVKDPTLGQDLYKTLQKKDITPQEIQEVNRSLFSVPIIIPQPLHDEIIARQATTSTIRFSPEENLIMNTAIETNIQSKKQISQQTHAHLLFQHHAALMDNPRQSLEQHNLLATTPELKDLPTTIQEELKKNGNEADYADGQHEKRVSILAEIYHKQSIGPQAALLAAAGILLNVPNALTKSDMPLPVNPEGALQRDKGMNKKMIKQLKKAAGTGSQQPPPQQPRTQITQEEQTTEEEDEASGEQTTTTTTKEKSFFQSTVSRLAWGAGITGALGSAGLGGLIYWSATQPTQNPDVPQTTYVILKSIGVIFSRLFS